MGMLCKESGCTFTWPKDGSPHLQQARGPQITCELQQNIPMVCQAKQPGLQFKVKAEDEALPAVGDHAQEGSQSYCEICIKCSSVIAEEYQAYITRLRNELAFLRRESKK